MKHAVKVTRFDQPTVPNFKANYPADHPLMLRLPEELNETMRRIQNQLFRVSAIPGVKLLWRLDVCQITYPAAVRIRVETILWENTYEAFDPSI